MTQVATPATPAQVAAPAAVEAPPPASQPPIAVAADQPLASLTEALTAITDFLTGLTDMLEDFSEQFAGEAQTGSTSFAFSYGFKLQVFSAMVSAIEAPQTDTEGDDGRELAAATIDELAAQLDAGIDISV